MVSTSSSWAWESSYYLQHPLTWASLLPTGESPGWKTNSWTQVELSEANVWNTDIKLYNYQSEKYIKYVADFEQTSLVLEYGRAINSQWAHSLVLPITYRGGGFLDHFIDQYHIFIHSQRMNRDEYPENRFRLDMSVDDVSLFSTSKRLGVGNVKYKLKYWPWQIKGNACACGFSTSLQIKAPVDSYKNGFTTGEFDYTSLSAIGIPLGNLSAIWFNFALTYVSKNRLTEDWSFRQWHQMYELSIRWGLNSKWNIPLHLRMESPFVRKDYLALVNDTDESYEKYTQRVGASWQSLTQWRGSESIGIQYLASDTQKWDFTLVEDWGFGRYNNTSSRVYLNNAPDVVFRFGFQWDMK